MTDPVAISPLSTLTKTFFMKQLICTNVNEASWEERIPPVTTYMYSMEYLCQHCHTLISGGNNIQKIYLPVKVSIPDGNFDTLVNFVLPIL